MKKILCFVVLVAYVSFARVAAFAQQNQDAHKLSLAKEILNKSAGTQDSLLNADAQDLISYWAKYIPKDMPKPQAQAIIAKQIAPSFDRHIDEYKLKKADFYATQFDETELQALLDSDIFSIIANRGQMSQDDYNKLILFSNTPLGQKFKKVNVESHQIGQVYLQQIADESTPAVIAALQASK